MKKTETKSTVLLQHHLKKLKLPTILAEYEKVAARCAADNVVSVRRLNRPVICGFRPATLFEVSRFPFSPNALRARA